MPQDNIVELNIGQAGSLVSGDIFVDYTTNTISGPGLSVEVLGQPVALSGLTLTNNHDGTYAISAATVAVGGTPVTSVGLTLPSSNPTSVGVSATTLGIATTVNESAISTQIACYCTGTLIRAVRDGAEVEVAVEHLAIGDTVVTASGAHRPVKWIGTRSYAGRFANNNPDALPVCIHAGALADGVPARDLRVSPKHAMFLDGVLVPAEHLVNGVTISKAERVECVTYWHVELDHHDVLLAEGAPAESFVDDRSRGLFLNAHEFAALYPGDVGQPARYCAPRVEHGYALQAIRARLAVRAGLAAPLSRFGALQGCIEAVEEGAAGVTVRGWARDEAHPHAPVCLDVVVAGAVVALTYADSHRGDLGTENCRAGFAVSLPALPAGTDAVIVRRSADGVVLPRVAVAEAA